MSSATSSESATYYQQWRFSADTQRRGRPELGAVTHLQTGDLTCKGRTDERAFYGSQGIARDFLYGISQRLLLALDTERRDDNGIDQLGILFQRDGEMGCIADNNFNRFHADKRYLQYGIRPGILQVERKRSVGYGGRTVRRTFDKHGSACDSRPRRIAHTTAEDFRIVRRRCGGTASRREHDALAFEFERNVLSGKKLFEQVADAFVLGVYGHLAFEIHFGIGDEQVVGLCLDLIKYLFYRSLL